MEKGEELALSHARISSKSPSIKWEQKDNLHLFTMLFRLSLGEKQNQIRSTRWTRLHTLNFRCTNACGHGCDQFWHNGLKLCFEIWVKFWQLRQLYLCLHSYFKKDQKHRSEILLSLNVWLNYQWHYLVPSLVGKWCGIV